MNRQKFILCSLLVVLSSLLPACHTPKQIPAATADDLQVAHTLIDVLPGKAPSITIALHNITDHAVHVDPNEISATALKGLCCTNAKKVTIHPKKHVELIFTCSKQPIPNAVWHYNKKEIAYMKQEQEDDDNNKKEIEIGYMAQEQEDDDYFSATDGDGINPEDHLEEAKGPRGSRSSSSLSI